MCGNECTLSSDFRTICVFRAIFFNDRECFADDVVCDVADACAAVVRGSESRSSGSDGDGLVAVIVVVVE